MRLVWKLNGTFKTSHSYSISCLNSEWTVPVIVPFNKTLLGMYICANLDIILGLVTWYSPPKFLACKQAPAGRVWPRLEGGRGDWLRLKWPRGEGVGLGLLGLSRPLSSPFSFHCLFAPSSTREPVHRLLRCLTSLHTLIPKICVSSFFSWHENAVSKQAREDGCEFDQLRHSGFQFRM